jgi:negative regulator of flagellin synthesis FlgM
VTNKIGGSGIGNRPVQTGSDRGVNRAKDSTGASSAASAAQPAASTTEGVRITDSARQLAALEQAIRDVPEVDEAKVAKVSSAIAEGSYKVAPQRIADKLIRLENELQK